MKPNLMMKTRKNLILAISLLCFSQPVSAQINDTNVDDLPDNLQQMRTWACIKGESNVAVEAKDVKYWQEVIEMGGWQCNEQVEPITQGDVMLSCDPYDVIGNLTVVWLKGEQGLQQMQAWMKQLSEQPGMVCQIGNEGIGGEL